MTPQGYLRSVLQQNSMGLAAHVERHLTFHIDQGAILDGPEMSRAVRLNQFVSLALETTAAPFHASSDVREFFCARNQFDKAAQKLAAILPILMSDIAIVDPSSLSASRFVFAPHLRLLGQVFFDDAISCYRGASYGTTDRIDADVAHAYNDFIARFRRVLFAEKLLRRELHNWGWGSCENVANLNTYLGDFFARHSGVTVLHLRLSHIKAPTGSITVPPGDLRRDLELLRESRTRFFDRMRRKPALFTDTPGYVWAIMPLVDGCYELHLTLLFSSAAFQKVLDDKSAEAALSGVACEDHADQIGAYWVRVATGGRGSYRRGDRTSRLYDPGVWVHGAVRADDIPGRDKLEKSLSYLACRRALVRLAHEPVGQYFGIQERKSRGQRQRVITGGGDAVWPVDRCA